MSKQMHKDLDRLLHDVLRMAGNVEEAIQNATLALETRNSKLAEEVLDRDDVIDRFENEVQEECLKILALHQPVAIDLRRIGALLRIATDLERMGDLAVGLSEIAVELARPPFPKFPTRLMPMSLRAIDMVKRSLNALVHSDAAEARIVVLMDDEVDADNDAIIAEIIARMKSSSDEIDAGLALHTAVRYVERIADHATSIAEEVIYVVQGEMVRHHPEAFQDAPAS